MYLDESWKTVPLENLCNAFRQAMDQSDWRVAQHLLVQLQARLNIAKGDEPRIGDLPDCMK